MIKADDTSCTPVTMAVHAAVVCAACCGSHAQQLDTIDEWSRVEVCMHLLVEWLKKKENLCRSAS